MAARKFDMAAAVANNPVEVEPENSSWCPRVAAMASKKAESDLKVSCPVAIEG
jgi:hypothetical protein